MTWINNYNSCFMWPVKQWFQKLPLIGINLHLTCCFVDETWICFWIHNSSTPNAQVDDTLPCGNQISNYFTFSIPCHGARLTGQLDILPSLFMGGDYWHIYKSLLSSAAITRLNVVSYCINNGRNNGRIPIRRLTHKRHHIPGLNGRAMGCLLWIFVRKLAAL